MGSKSRGNFQVNICLKDCENKGTKLCDMCISFSLYSPITSSCGGSHPKIGRKIGRKS